MLSLWAKLDRIDRQATAWMARHGIFLLRVSLGIVYLWFGALKFVPGLSPADELAAQTFDALTFGLISPRAAVIIVAVWESLIGIGLIFGLFLRTTLFLLFLQVLGAIAPLFLFPEQVFTRIPYAPTLAGQYIIKDIIIISAGIVIGATVRGGRLTSREAVHDPEPRRH